ncbi:hypothetical protein SCOR_07150 [Sulfidibacter corallicola]|uniref:Uncharacterized protein n=1 Tax=Sulfidibacter corallicola TaxID=2818388 RepID=A0A8A4TPU7_SULCO|nr:hypothetical protein [Sulfidibacter corallicola]QTD51457.1 hypothetical protein J3U87_03220 [Sulfidibacter corallicola]
MAAPTDILLVQLFEKEPDQLDRGMLAEELKRVKRGGSMGSPKQRSRYNRLKPHFAALQDLVEDERKFRVAWARACRHWRAERERERRSRIEALEKYLAPLREDGFVLSAIFDEMAQRFADLHSAEELRKVLTQAGVRVGSRPAPDPRFDVAPPPQMGEIERLLQSLGISDLYRFLDRPESCPTKELARAAADLSRTLLTQPNSDENDRRSQLAGCALAVFNSEPIRQAHDVALLRHRLKPLVEELAAANHHRSYVEMEQIERLVSRCRTGGGDPKLARAFLLDHCARATSWELLPARPRAKASRRPAPNPPSQPKTASPGSAGEKDRPLPPTDLVVRSRSYGMKLVWRAAARRDRTRYRVLRKRGSAPGHETDGELLADLAQNRFEDRDLQPGDDWFYGVFGVRGERFSRKAATSGPHRLAVTSTRSEAETSGQPDRPSRKRRSRGPWVLLALVVVGVLGLSWFSTREPSSPTPAQVSADSDLPRAPGSQSQATHQANPDPAAVSSAFNATSSAPESRPKPKPAETGAQFGGAQPTPPVQSADAAAPARPVAPRPPEPRRLPDVPTIALWVVGDPKLVSLVELELAQQLRKSRYRVVGSRAVRHHLGGSDHPDLQRVASAFSERGAHLMVNVHIERLSERQLNFYGRKGTAYVSAIDIDLIEASAGQFVQASSSERVTYSEVDVDRVVNRQVARIETQLNQDIQASWGAIRKGL